MPNCLFTLPGQVWPSEGAVDGWNGGCSGTCIENSGKAPDRRRQEWRNVEVMIGVEMGWEIEGLHSPRPCPFPWHHHPTPTPAAVPAARNLSQGRKRKVASLKKIHGASGENQASKCHGQREAFHLSQPESSFSYPQNSPVDELHSHTRNSRSASPFPIPNVEGQQRVTDIWEKPAASKRKTKTQKHKRLKADEHLRGILRMTEDNIGQKHEAKRKKKSEQKVVLRK